MGNSDSGRYSLGDARATVEDCLSIDTLGWLREGLSRPDTITFGTWQFIRYQIDTTEARVRLEYTQTDSPGYYYVNLVSTRPHYGGLRWWFLCPAKVAGGTCQRRVRKLYLAHTYGRFACRRCCQLVYTSQREGGMCRLLSKAQAIRQRVGGNASMGGHFPDKPKGMWRKTYRRLRARSEGFWRAALQAGLGRPPD